MFQFSSDAYPFFYIRYRNGGILLLCPDRLAAEGLLAGIAESIEFS
jgi:hypothetical protein